MSAISFNQLHNDQNELAGELTRHSIVKIPSSFVPQILLNKNIILDLSKITQIDTAGLAWLLHLVEQAENSDCQLQFSHLPIRLEKLIELSGVNGILPLINV